MICYCSMAGTQECRHCKNNQFIDKEAVIGPYRDFKDPWPTPSVFNGDSDPSFKRYLEEVSKLFEKRLNKEKGANND